MNKTFKRGRKKLSLIFNTDLGRDVSVYLYFTKRTYTRPNNRTNGRRIIDSFIRIKETPHLKTKWFLQGKPIKDLTQYTFRASEITHYN